GVSKRGTRNRQRRRSLRRAAINGKSSGRDDSSASSRPERADAEDARGSAERAVGRDRRGSDRRQSERLAGPFETLMRLRRSFGLQPMAAVVENLSGDGAFVRTTETINPGERVFWCSGYRRRSTRDRTSR